MTTPIQASLNMAKLFVGCYLIFVIGLMVIIGLAATYYFPDWTSLEVMLK